MFKQIMTQSLFALVFILSVSCENNNTACENALDASGANRKEIENVIKYYEKTGDTLKLQASLFLIENMINKHSFVSLNKVNKESLLSYISNLNDPIHWDPAYSILRKTIDSVLLKYPQKHMIIPDLEKIDANFLISNIDNAFSEWECSEWKDSYSFNDFCNYVLPYKINNEELNDWRREALKDSIPNEDYLKQNENIYDFGSLLAKHSSIRYNIGMEKVYYPLTFREIKQIGIGTCVHAANMIVYNSRSRGIPTAIDLIPAWANRSSSHMWSSIILPNYKSKEISKNEGVNDFLYKVSKIYRKTYEIQPCFTIKYGEYVPLFFANNDQIDVTDQYDMPLSTIEVNLLYNHSNNYVYLSTFNNIEWVAVAYARKKEQKATFEKVGRGAAPKGNNRMIKHTNQGNGIIYLPIYTLNKGILPAANPFILDTLGNIIEIKPSSRKEKVRLYRKYPKHPNFEVSDRSLVGGIFEGANKSDFSDAKILHVVNIAQKHPLESIKVNSKDKFRFIRFTPLHNIIASIAELQFFNKSGEQIIGKSINGAEVFDGNLLTWKYKMNNHTEHFIIDFEKPKHIAEIKISSRTDDNDVMKGEEYELLYWNNEWISLGKKIANEHYLDYEVFQNSLFLLKNHTKGIQERIFTVENGKQIWW